jgi:predicted nucleotide-binding protein
MGRSLDELRDFLRQRSVRFAESDIQNGTCVRCKGGEIINYFPKRGKIVVQGKTTTALASELRAWADEETAADAAADDAAPSAATATAAGLQKDIFIVYGHDDTARKGLELLLHRMGLNPIVLANLTPDGDTIIEKLDHYLGNRSHVGFACVLLTPDDEGHAAGHTEAKLYRARQNVILELGMVLSALGRARVAILCKETVERPSDIAGLIYVPFKERIEEAGPTLFRTLQNCGYQPRADALAQS